MYNTTYHYSGLPCCAAAVICRIYLRGHECHACAGDPGNPEGRVFWNMLGGVGACLGGVRRGVLSGGCLGIPLCRFGSGADHKCNSNVRRTGKSGSI